MLNLAEMDWKRMRNLKRDPLETPSTSKRDHHRLSIFLFVIRV